jgi:hypothetical protein
MIMLRHRRLSRDPRPDASPTLAHDRAPSLKKSPLLIRSSGATAVLEPESPSLVLVINDAKLLMPCVKCFELDISNTCDEGVCGKEW